jgi:hypothetical protein
MPLDLRRALRSRPFFGGLGVGVAVLVLAAAIGLAGAYAVTKTSTAVLIVLGLLLAALFGVIILGRWYLGAVIVLIYAPFEDYFRRVIYFGKQVPHLDPVHLVQEFMLFSVVAGILLQEVVRRRDKAATTRLRPSLLTVLIVFYLCYVFVQVFNPLNGNVLIGAQGFIDLGFYVLWFFVIQRIIRDPRQLRALLVISLCCAVVVALYGIYQHLHGLSQFDAFELHRLEILIGKQSATTFLYYGTEVRAFSTLGTYTACAAYLSINVLIATYLLLRSGSRWVRWLALAAMPIMAFCLLYTYSRTNWLGATAGVLLLVTLMRRWAPQRKAMLLAFLLLAGVALYGVLGQIGQSSLAVGNPVLQRFAQLTNGQGQTSVRERVSELGYIFSFVNHNPLGAGTGANIPGTAGSTGEAKVANVRNDSYYPLLLFEIGYPGLLLFLAIALGIVATGLRQLERVRTREVHGLGALMLTIVCMLLATSLGEPYLNMAPIPTYFWLAAGVAVSLLALDRRVLLGRVAALPGALELDAAGAGVAAAPPVGAGTVGGGA